MNLGSLRVSRAEVGRDQNPGGLSPADVSDKKGRGAGSPGIPCRSAGEGPGWVEGDIAWIVQNSEAPSSLVQVDVVSMVHKLCPWCLAECLARGEPSTSLLKR